MRFISRIAPSYELDTVQRADSIHAPVETSGTEIAVIESRCSPLTTSWPGHTVRSAFLPCR